MHSAQLLSLFDRFADDKVLDKERAEADVALDRKVSVRVDAKVSAVRYGQVIVTGFVELENANMAAERIQDVCIDLSTVLSADNVRTGTQVDERCALVQASHP